MSIYIAKKPFKSRFSNRIEIMNEFFMSSICYTAIVVTDYLSTVLKKYEGAWVAIGLVVLTLFINIAIVVWCSVGNLRLFVVKYRKRARRWAKRTFAAMKPV